MERKTKAKNNKGITLIALVISIIVMLILAGVSINAVVGDNGILGKATDAVYLQSAAVLEEYFNQLYAEGAIDGNEEGETPLATIMKNGYQHYFFSTSEGYCLKKNYTNSDTGETQTLVLYLVKKEQLPEEIRNQIKGADNLESRDYRKLNGVYGITSDLRAYYCQSGIDSMLGLTTSDLNADSPDIVYADESSTLAQIINGGTAPITNQGLKSIKTLTIDSAEKLTILPEFSKFINLTTVYFKNITIESLAGIAGASKINYLKFTNCNVQDYSAINGLTELAQLYLVSPAGKNEEIARLGSIDKGIASGEFSKLQYFGIVGYDGYLNSSTTSYSGTRYDVTDISGLSNFSETTKKAIKYMNLQNLQLTSISALADFTNVYLIRLEENALTTLDGIQNMSGLKYLIAPCQYSNATASYTLGINEGDTASDTDALKYIYKDNNANTILYYVDLRNNRNLKYVDSLGQCSGIRYLYMAGCSNIQNASTMATTIGNCGANMSLNSTYTLDVISTTSQTVDLSNRTISLDTLKSLENCTNLWRLNLENIKLTDSSGTIITDSTIINTKLNETLSKLKNMQYLNLKGIAGLSTIDFIGANKITLLRELNLRSTSVKDLTNLNDYAKNLQSLLLQDNLLSTENKIDLTTIQPTISRFSSGGWERGQNYWSNGSGSGLMLGTAELYKSLEQCTSLTKLQCANNFYGYPNKLDMSNSKLMTEIYGYYPGGIKISSSVKFMYTWSSSTVKLDLSDATSIENLSLEGFGFSSDPYMEEWTKNSLKNCVNLKTISFSGTSGNGLKGFRGLSNLDSTINYPMQSITFYQYGGDYKPVQAIDLHGLDNYKNLTSLRISEGNTADLSGIENCIKLTYLHLGNLRVTDISPLTSLVNLENLYLFKNEYLSDISVLKNLTNLKYLDLSNCSISDIYPLRNCTKLETLKLQNNALNDFSYYKDENGRSVGYEVMDIFYDLNYKKKGSLKNLYISGNTFDDTEILLDLPWDAKSGF